MITPTGVRYGKFVHKPEDIPTGEHWAIIEGSSVFIPGDERSRTNPGHGYPESTKHFITYEAFTSEIEFRTAFSARLNGRRPYSSEISGIHVAGTFAIKPEFLLQEKRS